jgi:Ca2+-binding EF-hand superfamily protein
MLTHADVCRRMLTCADEPSGTGEKGISLQALREALTRNGIVKTEEEVEALFRSVDADSNAYIDFEVFVRLYQ